MLHILGNIGKGIGITIICLLIVLIVLLVALLWIPVRYRILAKKEDGKMLPEITVNVSWLLRILSFQACYNEELSKNFYVLGIPIRKKKSKKAYFNKRKERKKEDKLQQSENLNDDFYMKDNESKAVQWNPQPALQATSRKTEPEKKNFFKRMKDKLILVLNLFKNLYQKIIKLPEKITKFFIDISDRIEFYKSIWERDEMKRTVILCKEQLLHVWKNVHPRVIKGEIHFGFEDPAITGQVLGAYGAIYPFLGNRVRMLPEFETTVLEGNLMIKGYITIFVLLKVLWILYFNKDIRILIAAWKKEDV